VDEVPDDEEVVGVAGLRDDRELVVGALAQLFRGVAEGSLMVEPGIVARDS